MLFAAMLLAFLPSPADACSCTEPPPPAEAAAEADAVFVGRVIGMELRPSQASESLPEEEVAVVTLQVQEEWTATGESTLVVETSWTCCFCGFPFHLGQSYLVYARRSDDRLVTSQCSRTAKVSEASLDLQVLGLDASQELPGER